MKTEPRTNTVGERGRRAEGERRTSRVPGIGIEHGTPCPTAFGVNLRGSSPAGFTLVELLVTLIIIMILTGLIVGVAKYASTKAATSRTQAEIAAMEMALEHYKSDNGVYPWAAGPRVTAGAQGYPGTAEYSNSAVLYAALAGGPKRYYNFKADQLRTNTTLSAIYIVDPFGNPYNYYQTNDPTLVTNVAAFDLWSYGPNGRNDEGTNDDITNWRR